jgi:predicted transglutaminase-like cysteine proteinase
VQTAGLARQLATVNAFFNALPYAPDSEHWHVDDYWATPAELLRSNAGDCEDFVIGKYFTLRVLGVPEERLRLTYAIAGRPARAHMVLAYYESPGAEPLILDSLQPEIRRASQRPDLAPVFGFNGHALWVGGALQSAVSDPSARLSNWRGLLARLPGDPLITSI